jgi:hypothetical protein
MAQPPDPSDDGAPFHSPLGTPLLSFPGAARASSPDRPASALLLTPRDRALLQDVYRFGCLSAVQLTRRHWPDSPSQKTAWNRLRQLVVGEYLLRRSIGHREDGAYLLTNKGRAELGLPTRHARPVLNATSSLRHRLIVADVADWLRSREYRGGDAEWVSEVDVYDGRLRLPRRPTKKRERGRGALMVPDGVLVLTGGERVWRLAVEVELHQKSSVLYDDKLTWYAGQFEAERLDAVLWLTRPPASPAPILAAARRAAGDAAKLVQADPLPADVTPY